MRPARHRYSDEAKRDLADIRGRLVLILCIIHQAQDRDAIMGDA